MYCAGLPPVAAGLTGFIVLDFIIFRQHVWQTGWCGPGRRTEPVMPTPMNFPLDINRK